MTEGVEVGPTVHIAILTKMGKLGVPISISLAKLNSVVLKHLVLQDYPPFCAHGGSDIIIQLRAVYL